jgi:hypothetical protein
MYLLLAQGRWFSKTDIHDIAEILLKVTLNTNKLKNALKCPTNFRHFVLEQKTKKRIFQTNKYQKKVVTIDQLLSNLILLIEMAKQNKGKYANFITL